MALAKTAPSDVQKLDSNHGTSSLTLDREEREKVDAKFRLLPKDKSVFHLGQEISRDEFYGSSEKKAASESQSSSTLEKKYNLTPRVAEKLGSSQNKTASLAIHSSSSGPTISNLAGTKIKQPSSNTPQQSKQGEFSKKTEAPISHGSLEADNAWKHMQERAEREAKEQIWDPRREWRQFAVRHTWGGLKDYWKTMFGNTQKERVEAAQTLIAEPTLSSDASGGTIESEGNDSLSSEPTVVEVTQESFPVAEAVEEPVYIPPLVSTHSDIGIQEPQRTTVSRFGSLPKSFSGGAKEFIQKTQAGQTVTQGKNVAQGVKKIKGIKGAIGKVKTAVSLAVNGARALALDPKAIFNLAKMALQSGIGKKVVGFLKDVGSKAAVIGAGVFAYLLTNLLATLGGAVGIAVGLVFPALGPLGVLAFGGGGFGMGLGLQSVLGGGGSIGGVLSGISGAISGAWSAITATSVVSTLPLFALGGIVVSSAVYTFLNQVYLTEAFRAYALSDGSLVTVTKTVDKSSLPNNPNDKIVYTIEITTTSEAELQIAIDDSVVELTPNKLNATIAMPSPASVTPADTISNEPTLPTKVSAAKPVKIVYQALPIVGPQFNDSILKNTVAVTVADPNGGGKTITAEASVAIGDVVDAPYGYPMTGTITSLDDEEITAPDGKRPHSSFNILGGLDISPRGSTDFRVYSTVTGKITRSTFDKNFGGVIQIQAGPYWVNYMHLADTVTTAFKVGDTVVRGQLLGNLYPGTDLTDATAPHLHYQVTRNGQNLYFSRTREDATGQKNYGPCLVDGVRSSFIQPEPPLKDRVNGQPLVVVKMTDCTASSGGTSPTPSPTLNACPLPTEASSFCSIEKLRPVFGNNAEVLDSASRICQRESRGNPQAMLDQCPNNVPGPYPKSYDLGLFQISMFNHCKGAYKAGAPNACPANVQSSPVLEVCKARAFDPVENMKWAKELFDARGGNFMDWKPTPALEKCSINYFPGK